MNTFPYHGKYAWLKRIPRGPKRILHQTENPCWNLAISWKISSIQMHPTFIEENSTRLWDCVHETLGITWKVCMKQTSHAWNTEILPRNWHSVREHLAIIWKVCLIQVRPTRNEVIWPTFWDSVHKNLALSWKYTWHKGVQLALKRNHQETELPCLKKLL